MLDKVTLVIHALHSGGAERVLARLANHWAAAGVTVTVITLDAVASDVFPLHAAVRRIGLAAMQPSRSRGQAVCRNLARLRRLRQAIRRAGARRVISFTDKMNILTLLACLGMRREVVIAERSDPRHQRLSPGWERLRRWSYPRCRTLVVQTEAVAQWGRTLVGARPVVVIPNAAAPWPPGAEGGPATATDAPARAPSVGPAEPVAVPAGVQHPPLTAAPRHTVLAMGRLSREKGFDLLVRAFAQVTARHADWDLLIVGEGPERAALERLIAESGCRGRIALGGWTDAPHAALQHADLFVLPSRYEGFPNALLEALAGGLPAISFACDSGPREILRHEVDGLLVPPEDVAGLAAALDRLMADPDARQRFSRHAREALTRFSETDFFRRWDALLAEQLPAS